MIRRLKTRVIELADREVQDDRSGHVKRLDMNKDCSLQSHFENPMNEIVQATSWNLIGET